jgi:uncharacterized SAM-binding protein YcdF (DUF218 family)
MTRLLLVIVVGLALMLPYAGSFLVLDRPAPSDAGVVLQGDWADFRINRGIDLLKKGVARELFLDADGDARFFGKTLAQHAQAYIQTLPPDLAARIHVCPITAKSTLAEASDVERCLAPLRPNRVLIITSDYHTRRALSVFRAVLPKYAWSVAATRDPSEFREQYWKGRESAKTTLLEWQKLLFWNLLERWRVRPVS